MNVLPDDENDDEGEIEDDGEGDGDPGQDLPHQSLGAVIVVIDIVILDRVNVVLRGGHGELSNVTEDDDTLPLCALQKENLRE